jgi:branched-chain amino acid transport system permease protein
MSRDATSAADAVGKGTGLRQQVPFLPELVIAALGIAAFFLFPDDLALLMRILITALFVLSLSLVLGQAGIATLGHAAFLGIGAYSAGLFALHISGDPIFGLVVGGIAGALVAIVSGALLLRTHGLTFLMLTIAVAQILYELANQASWLTGGDDGLSGYRIDPIFGVFKFDFYSRTGYLYVLVVLVLSYFAIRRLVESPFGLSIRGIRSDQSRMQALGSDVHRQLLVVFTIGGFFAGLAGALTAQTSQVVGLSSLGFSASGDALVMLIVGGSRRLSGAIIGTIVFMVIHHFASAINPYHWQFVIGALLVACVLALPNGLVGLIDIVRAKLPGQGGARD